MLFLVTRCAWCAQPLTLATVEWPPFYGQNLPQKGYIYATTKEAFKRAGYDVTVVFLPWKRALELTRLGKYDGLLGVYHTDARELDFVFSDVILHTKEVFVFPSRQRSSYQSLQDLHGKTVGGLRGTAPLEDLKRYMPSIDVDDVADEERGLLQLYTNRIDLMLINIERFNYLMKVTPSTVGSNDELLLSKLVFSDYSLHCAIRRTKKDSKLIIDNFNKELKVIISSGKYDHLIPNHTDAREVGLK